MPPSPTTFQAGQALPAVGSEAYNQASQGQAATGSFNAPAATPPTTNAGNLNGAFPQVQLPAANPGSNGNTGQAVAATDGLSTLAKTLSDNATAEKAKADQLQANQKESQSWLTNLFNSGEGSATQTRANAEQTYNIQTQQAAIQSQQTEISSLNLDLNNTISARDAAVEKASENSSGGFGNAVNFDTARINAYYAPLISQKSAIINSKSANLQASQGNLSQAQTLVNQAVADATADYKNKVDMFNTFYTMNQDAINRLDTQYQNSMSQALDIAKTQYQDAYDTASKIMTVALQYPDAGILSTDSQATAEQKIQNSASYQTEQNLKKAQAANEWRAANAAGTNPKTYKISSGDTLASVAQKQGLTLSALQGANPSVDANNLRPGQVINLPTNSTTNSSNTFGSPTAADKSALFTSLAGQPKSVQDTIDMNRLQTDPTYFYWVQNQLGQ